MTSLHDNMYGWKLNGVFHMCVPCSLVTRRESGIETQGRQQQLQSGQARGGVATAQADRCL